MVELSNAKNLESPSLCESDHLSNNIPFNRYIKKFTLPYRVTEILQLTLLKQKKTRRLEPCKVQILFICMIRRAVVLPLIV